LAVSTLTGNYSSTYIDVHAPSVDLVAGPGNGTTRPTNNETLVLACANGTFPEPLQCTIWVVVGRAGYSDAPGGPVPCGDYWCSLDLLFRHNDVAVVTYWAEDAAGNVGPPTLVTWTVDSLIPITLWPPGTLDVGPGPALRSKDSLEVEVACSRSGCRFLYSLNGGPEVFVNGSSSGGSGNSSTAGVEEPAVVTGVGVDTRAVLWTPKVTSDTQATVALTALYNGTVMPTRPGDAMFLQVGGCMR
jgi:hypothetical protein